MHSQKRLLQMQSRPSWLMGGWSLKGMLVLWPMMLGVLLRVQHEDLETLRLPSRFSHPFMCKISDEEELTYQSLERGGSR